MAHIENDLVYFGNECLTNDVFTVENSSRRNVAGGIIQGLPKSRLPGMSVVNTRLDAKEIELSGTLKINSASTDYDNLQVLIKNFTKIFNNESSKYLRFCPEHEQHIFPHEISEWTLGGDGTNKTNNVTKYQLDGSMGFDIDVSSSANDYTTLRHNGGVNVDMTSKFNAGNGNIEFWLYIPDVYYLTSIDVRIGSNASNYYSTNLTTDYQGNTFQNGVMLFSFPFKSGLTVTGSPNLGAIDYFFVQINYLPTAEDINGCYIDGIAWVNEDRTRNFPCYLDGEIEIEGEHYNNTFAHWRAKFLNYTGYALSTGSYDLFTKTGVTTGSDIETFSLDGSLPPIPTFNINVITATGLSLFSLIDLDTQETFGLNPASVTAGDLISLGGENLAVTNNGTALDFSGVIPSFKLGNNRMKLAITGASDTLITMATAGGTYVTNNQYSTDDTSYNYKIAQSFSATLTGTLTKLEITSVVISAGAFNRYAPVAWSIRSDNAGSPSSTILASGIANIFPAGGYGGTPPTFNVTIAGLSMATVNTTKYWIVFNSYYKFSSSYWYLKWDKATAYASNTAKWTQNGGSSWTDFSVDLMFQVTQSPNPAWNVNWLANYRKRFLA